MKNKNKHLKLLADKIVLLEKELELGKNVKENQAKIEEIILSLSFEEVLELDNYIFEKNLLTKQNFSDIM
jgi:hypothetical protein